MDFDEESDERYLAVKNKLNKDKIKLWFPPYVKSNGKKNSKKLKDLAGSISEQVSVPREMCVRYLEKLQIKGISNYKERNKYLDTGEASLKVRVFYECGEASFTIAIKLNKRAYDLKMKISKKASIGVHRLRLVFRGKFLEDDLTLKEQQIKHGLHLIGVVIKENCQAFNPEYDSYDGIMTMAVADIATLTKNGYFQVSDQCRKMAELPLLERNTFVRAMKLHLMGRTAIKKGEFPLALVLLLEAQKKFCQYEPSLLKIFDNCGMLNIDIVWCYMNLQILILLPDAEERLYQCEYQFKESYGANMERIDPSKDVSWAILILSMRIHLLQAAAHFLQHKTYKAKILLKQAEEEIRILDVNDRGLSRLIELGYREMESRFAIKDAKGDVNKAISKMEKRRTEMAKRGSELLKAEKSVEKQDKLEANVLPSVPNTTRSESVLYRTLLSMGCSSEISKCALEQRQRSGIDGSEGSKVNMKDILNAITNIGFKRKRAKAALKKHKGNFDDAVIELFENEFLLGHESYLEIEEEDDDNNDDDDDLEDLGQEQDQDKDKDGDKAKDKDEEKAKDEDNEEDKDEEGDGNDDDGDQAACNDDPNSMRPFLSIVQHGDTAYVLFMEGTEKIQYDYIDNSLDLEIIFLKKYKSYGK